MKAKIAQIIFLLFSMTIAFSSCKKDEEIPAPQITLSELGLNNSGTAYIGSDVHIEADIVAEGTISTVSVEIHPEGAGNWEFDTTYTKFSGLKNTTFHEHIDVPLTVVAGAYHFHLVVTDLEGKQSSVEADLMIEAPTDSIAPQISITSSPTSGQIFMSGDTIRIAGNVSDNVSLGGIYVGLVRDDQALADADVNADNTITLLHFHDFIQPLTYDFNAGIVVGAATDHDITPDNITWPSGNYYLLVKCVDAFGANWTFSNHYSLVIH